MINSIKTAILLTVSCLICAWRFAANDNNVVHPVSVHHPGMKTDKDCKLIENRDSTGQTIDFYMDVQSVICLNGECKIVDVRLQWDRMGAYEKYSLAEGVELEKKDGLPFEEEDYVKLQEILSDKKSPLLGYELSEVVNTKSDTNIDGISGATILTDPTVSVKGAAWTCYTLWHWANGDLQNIIKEITGNTASVAELNAFLRSNDERFRKLALQQFEQRKMYDAQTLDLVKTQSQNFSTSLTKQAVSYFKSTADKVFFSTISDLFASGTEAQRLLYLEALTDEKYGETEGYLPELSAYISRLKSFQEVNLFINYLEENQITIPQIQTALLTFLEGENFLIARRVYWFLSEQDLPPKQEKRVKAFAKKHEKALY